MLLILSAQFVGEDIASEFGQLPPSFMPLGNQRLFSAQIEAARGEACFMTVPEDFGISNVDRRLLEQSNITLLPQSRGLRLTAAIGDALGRIKPEGPIRILYGDTIVRMPPSALRQNDMVAVQETTTNYTWAFVEIDAANGLKFSDDPPQRLHSRHVICGYYDFYDPNLLAEACCQDSIVTALSFYNDHRPLVCCDAENWLDFGHLPLYFQSRKDIQVKRVFNEINYEDHLLIKHSTDTAKMRSEAHWYENLPRPLKLHVPRYSGRVERNYRAGYGIEYLYTPLLSDLAVFGRLPLVSWLEIIRACFELLDKCHAISPPEGAPEASPEFAAYFFQNMIVDKTWSRLEQYSEQSGIALDSSFTLNTKQFPPLYQVVENLIGSLSSTQTEQVRFWHGDLFFGNMFYDFTARRVLCIDPRGQLGPGEFSLYGDLRYDLAKLAHSIIGQYDKILLGRSILTQNGPYNWDLEFDQQAHQTKLEQIFCDFAVETCGVGAEELLALTALLFLSLLPLHGDRPDLQRHFLANGLRLYGQINDPGPE